MFNIIFSEVLKLKTIKYFVISRKCTLLKLESMFIFNHNQYQQKRVFIDYFFVAKIIFSPSTEPGDSTLKPKGNKSSFN